MREAKSSGKIEDGFEVPPAFRDNCPERIERALEPARAAELIGPFPFGTDFTPTEQRLLPALTRLGSASQMALARFLMRGIGSDRDSAETRECLERMGLARPRGLSEFAYRALLRGSLNYGH